MTYKAYQIFNLSQISDVINILKHDVRVSISIMKPTAKDNRLLHLVIRVPKSHSAFIYFTFEANDGLCFYSTLESTPGQPYRDIDIKSHISLADEVLRLIDVLSKECLIEILKNETIKDK